ncbi:MAG TPA: ABC transporter ATP-binding protein [Ruminococcaceae bacterium]|nr:ABC transporter ATP-binding protein [Oscillospiraceae bacterium]
MFGLLGANGAGKTTTLRLLCGLVRSTSGEIALDGQDVSSEAYRDVLGYLPQDFGYYPDFTGRDFLRYLAALKDIDNQTVEARIADLLERVNLTEAAGKKVKTYSGGMRRRLGIAQALLGEPCFLVLDEPTAGLDPKERAHFRNMIANLGKDRIVLLSTHIVSDIEKIADRILIMKDGSIIFDGTEANIGGDLEAFYLKQFGGEQA